MVQSHPLLEVYNCVSHPYLSFKKTSSPLSHRQSSWSYQVSFAASVVHTQRLDQTLHPLPTYCMHFCHFSGILSANGPSIACIANMCWKAEHHSTDTCWISQMGSSNSSIIFYYNWVLPQQERRPFEPGSQAIWACQAMQCTFIVQSHVWHNTCILLRRLCWPLGSLLRPDLVMLVQGYLGYLRVSTELY